MLYSVAFAQWHNYEIEAENEEEALTLAEEEFVSDMHSPIANVVWDEVIVYDDKWNEVIHGNN